MDILFFILSTVDNSVLLDVSCKNMACSVTCDYILRMFSASLPNTLLEYFCVCIYS